MTHPLYVINTSLRQSDQSPEQSLRFGKQMESGYVHEHERIEVLHAVEDGLGEMNPLASGCLVLA